MNPTRKTTSLITRIRYSALINRGKENAIVRTARIENLGSKAALLRQRVEDNALHLYTGGSASPKTMTSQSPKTQDNVREPWTFRCKRKLRRAAGQTGLRCSAKFLLCLKSH